MPLCCYITARKRISKELCLAQCFCSRYFVILEKIISGLIFCAYLVLLGVVRVVRGFKEDKLGIVNSGMAVIVLSLVTKFYDSDFDFIVKGLGFIILGLIFLAVNMLIIRKRKVRK